MIRLLPLSKMLVTARYLYENRRAGQGIYPFYASLKVTDRCQFHCSFCNVWRQPARDLDTNGMIQVLRNLGRSSIVLTSIEGGEPLLRKDIEVLLEEASRQPYYILFTTSAMNLLSYPLDRFSRLFLKSQKKVERRHFRQRRALMYFEKERKKTQRQMGQDPYLDTPGS